MIVNQFEIEKDEYYGDFNLELTINSGQTSQPPWKHHGNTYYELITLNNTQILVEITQNSTNRPLKVKYYSNDEIDEEKLKEKIFYIFDLNYDITEIYDYLNNNKELQNVYKFNKGLRLFKAQYSYECIISSICSANNSIKRWTKSITDIREHYGKKTEFNNKNYYSFPEENVFLDISEEKLEECGVGYRSSYMINSTRKIVSEKNYHKKIEKLTYPEAYKKIIELDGVGPKVADCILLYGYNKHEAYPVDVWINRITTYIYFNNQKPTNKQIMNFAHEKFGKYAGYIQLYLFNYARQSGLMTKLKELK